MMWNLDSRYIVGKPLEHCRLLWYLIYFCVVFWFSSTVNFCVWFHIAEYTSLFPFQWLGDSYHTVASSSWFSHHWKWVDLFVNFLLNINRVLKKWKSFEFGEHNAVITATLISRALFFSIIHFSFWFASKCAN